MAASTTLTSAAASTPIVFATQPSVWQNGVSLLVNFSNGGPASATVDVQLSNNYSASNPSAAAWNTHDSLSALTNDANGILTVPVSAVRLAPNAAAATPYVSGTVTLSVGYAFIG